MKRHLLVISLIHTLAITAPLFAAEGSSPAALDPEVEKILDRQEARGKDLKDIKCKLEYIKEDEVLNDKQTLKGTLLFKEADPNPLFLIEFDEKIHEGVKDPKKEWHMFDGRWYIEARESGKSIMKHEVLRPGEKKNVFKLGEGPFPVPFGQKKKDIIGTFTIKLKNEAKDPLSKTADHLECTPRPGTELARRYGKVEFWISRETHLPVKLKTQDKQDNDQSITAIFRDLEINKSVPGSKLELPSLPGYVETEDPLPPISVPTIDKGIGK